MAWTPPNPLKSAWDYLDQKAKENTDAQIQGEEEAASAKVDPKLKSAERKGKAVRNPGQAAQDRIDQARALRSDL